VTLFNNDIDICAGTDGDGYYRLAYRVCIITGRLSG